MKLITLLTIIVLFGACSQQENDTASQPQAEPSTPLLNTQLDALESAEEAEGMLDDAVKKREEEMQKRGI